MKRLDPGPWTRFYQWELGDFWRSYRRAIPWSAAAFLLMFDFSVLLALRRVAVAVGEFAPANLPAAVLLHSLLLVAELAMVELRAIIGSLLILSIWASLAFPAFILTQGLVQWIYQLFVEPSHLQDQRATRYLRFLHATMRKRMTVLVIVYLVACGIAIIKFRVFDQSVPRMARAYVLLLLPGVPIVYGAVWWQLLAVRSSRYAKRRAKGRAFDAYLLSRHAVQRRFKTVVDALVYFSLLGWVLIPILFAGFEACEVAGVGSLRNRGAYAERWTAISEPLSASELAPARWLYHVPAPDDLGKRVSMVSELGVESEQRKALQPLQQWMFLVVTLIATMEIGLPAVINAIKFQNRRKALLGVLAATTKSTILVLVLEVLIRKAYFIDTGRVMSVSTIFLFSVSYFLMQQTVPEPEENPEIDEASPSV